MDLKTKYSIVLLSLCSLLLSSGTISAQVTIGSSVEPDADAILDLKEKSDGTSQKGLLLPRVNLRTSTDAYPLTTHVEGMLVYNKKDSTTIKPGVFYNDGTQWKRIDILPGAQPSEVITVGSDLQPTWGDLDVPDVENIGYVMRDFTVSNKETGKEFTDNSGYAVTVKDYPWDNNWFKFEMTTPYSVTPTHRNNRLIVTMQTIIQSDGDGTSADRGWVDYAGAVFINDRLNVVKLGQFSHTGRDPFDTMTIYLIVENLPVGQVQHVDIAVARLASKILERIGIGIPITPNPVNLNNFMAKPFIAIQYYEDPSSPTTN
jgi:hypothetical protein